MDIKTKQNVVSEFKGSQAKAPAAPGPEKQLQDVASLYEKQFLREMVKQMRTTVSESQVMPSSFAEKYYREELDHQYVESWGDRGGIGLGKIIYDQLLSKYGELLGIKVPNEKVRGPLPLTQKDQWSATVEVKNKSIKFSQEADSQKKDPTSIEAPWEGEWLGSYALENGMRVIELKHQGVKSQLVGDFLNFKGEPGMKLKAGAEVGTLKPNSKDFYWKLTELK